jgi:glycosyltransferase involved in cell wall biosynthesis
MQPLISCLCITERRVPLLKRAVTCFLSQTYAAKELLVVYPVDDTDTLDYLLHLPDPRIRSYAFQPAPHLSLGDKRNISIREANGEYFCQWDDDDWYPNQRLEIQMEMALSRRSQGSVLMRIIIFNSAENQAYLSFPRPWENTILAKKSLIDQGFRYPSLNQKEDTAFVNNLMAHHKLCVIRGCPAYIYVYHGSNTWNQDHFNFLFFHSHCLPSSVSQLIQHILLGQYTPEEASRLLGSEEVLEEMESLLRR